MTNREAIYELREMIIEMDLRLWEKYKEPLALAIDALEAQESTDLISKQAAIEAARNAPYVGDTWEVDQVVKASEQIPSVISNQDLEKLTNEVATLKRYARAENRDYLTGYLCALSTVEGMIACLSSNENDIRWSDYK